MKSDNPELLIPTSPLVVVDSPLPEVPKAPKAPLPPMDPIKPATLTQLAVWYLCDIRTTCSELSVLRYRQDLVKFIRFVGPNPINRSLAMEFSEEMQKHFPSEASYLKCMVIINQFFRWALKKGYIPINPFDWCKMRESKKRRTRVAGYEDYIKMQEAATSEDVRLFLAIAFWTGLRFVDIYNLKWDQVNFCEEMIKVRPRKTFRHEISTVIPMPEGSELYEKLYLRSKNSKAPYVFSRERTHTQFRDLIKKSMDPFGKSPHDFRRNFISMAARSGVDTEVAMKIVGLRNPETFRGYIHLTDDQVRDAGRKMIEQISRTKERYEQQRNKTG